MQIQKGLVKYKDRSDIICNYGITDDGKQYYFLDGYDLTNGNIIATTSLVEAIDPVVVASSIGLIDPNGNVLIPFDNKSIKPISSDILLVEKATPVTESVLESVSLRSDPLAATKLVAIPAAIKDKMYAKMGPDGRFAFNNQFSEATVCDINGNNLIEGELYSFVGVTKDKLYFSKNIIDSPIYEYSLLPQKEQSSIPEKDDNVLKLDISEVTVSRDSIEEAINNQMKEQEKVYEKETNLSEKINSLEKDEVSTDVEPPIVPPIVESDDVNNEGDLAGDDLKDLEAVAGDSNNISLPLDETEPTDLIDEVQESVPSNEKLNDSQNEIDVASSLNFAPTSESDIPVNEETTLNDTKAEKDLEIQEDDIVFDNASTGVDLNDGLPAIEEKDDNSYSSVDIFSNEEAKDTISDLDTKKDLGEDDIEYEQTEVESVAENDSLNDDLFAIEEDTSLDEEKGSINLFATEDDDNLALSVDHELEIDKDGDTDLSFESILPTSDVDEYTPNYHHTDIVKDTIIEDAATTMSNLIKLNRSQMKKLSSCEEHINQLTSAGRKIAQRSKQQARDIDILKNKIMSYEAIVSKLEVKNQILGSRVHDQERIIAAQKEELSVLRPQVEGKKNLAKLLEDAQSLLGTDRYNNTDDDTYSKMMIA